MELLEKHFDIAFTAPDGIKRLRELVLTLAMQGKLVPQDQNEQPASELLKEIEAEKQHLVKKGKIKKPKPLLEIKLEEVPYKLPHGWVWVRLGDIGIIGSSSRVLQNDWRDSGVPFYRAREIVKLSKQGFVNNELFITEELFQSLTSSGLSPAPGDVMITGVGTIGVPYVVKEEDKFYFKDASVLIFKNQFKISPLFLSRFFESHHWISSIHKESMGTTVHTLTIVRANEAIIPLPPRAEQHRIVAKIDQLMARCDELEKLRTEREKKRTIVHTSAVNRLLSAQETNKFINAWQFIAKHFGELYLAKENVTELRKTILQLAVMGKLVPQNTNDQPVSELLKDIEADKRRLVKEGKIKVPKTLSEIKPEEVPYRLPNGWKWVRVNEFVDVGTGSTPATTNRDYYNGDIPWYTSSATNKLFADKPETFITDKAIKDTNCKIFPSGTLIIAMYGQGKTRGQISEIETPGATNQAIAAMVFYSSSKEIKNYLKYFFIKIYEEIRSIAEGAAQPNLNVGKIKNTLVPLPPLAEQRRIVAKIDQLMALCDNLDKQIDASTQKQSTLLNAVMAQI
ncbi:MAG TPA: restriction endonuclease subunit S [Dongiaceae bacterium]|nr:restriction endonuclease subunit S [Dongiaceae bacterium]